MVTNNKNVRRDNLSVFNPRKKRFTTKASKTKWGWK